MHSAVTIAEITASAVMKISVLRRSRGKVTCEIHLGQQPASGIKRRRRIRSAVPSDAARRPARTRPDALAPAKTGHHFVGIRKRNAAPAWFGGHNVRV